MPTKTTNSQPGGGGYGRADKNKRRDSQADSEKKAPAISFEVYHSEALTFQAIREYRKAINSYTKALELKPKDKNCYISRAQCYLLLGEAEKSLADANETLKDDSNYIKGVLMKAEAYYQMTQFEFALMFYHRGHKLRPEVQAFRLGIQKSREAIENCIGDKAGIRLQSKGDLSFFYEEQQQKPKQVVTYSRIVAKVEESPEERKNKFACRNSKTCKQLLGELYTDKEFLEKLLQETEAASNQSETNKKIRSLAIQGLDYLDTRSEFWQQQKPMYSRRRDRNLRENVSSLKEPDQSSTSFQRVLRNLEEIDEAQTEGKYGTSLKQARRALKEVESWSESAPNRSEFLANLHSCIGNACLELGEYTEALQHHHLDHEIAKKHFLPDAESRALDNLGRVHARMGKFSKAIDVWKKKLPMCRSPLEKTWLYHEIGRCHLEMGEYEQALDYGEKSLQAAEKVNDDIWQLNATVLVAQSQVKLGELYSALESFEKAQNLARDQKDNAADQAIQKAIGDINDSLDNKTDHDNSVKQSPRESSRRTSPSSPKAMKSYRESETGDKSDGEDGGNRSRNEKYDERENVRQSEASSGDETNDENSDDDSRQRRKRRDSAKSESEREKSDEDTEKEQISVNREKKANSPENNKAKSKEMKKSVKISVKVDSKQQGSGKTKPPVKSGSQKNNKKDMNKSK